MSSLARKSFALALVAGAAAMALAFRAADHLIVDGKTTAVETRTIAGSTYIKLADVAKAMDLVVVNRGAGTYELTKAGGANGIAGLTGGIGDTIFDGTWRLTVLGMETTDRYTMTTDAQPYGASAPYEWNSKTMTIAPARGHRLVILRVRVANGTKTRHNLWTAPSDDAVRTALTDTAGSSYIPVAYDYTGGPIQTPSVLPGAGLTFPVIFSVPTGATIKDLIFTLRSNESGAKRTDVRVSLSKP